MSSGPYGSYLFPNSSPFGVADAGQGEHGLSHLLDRGEADLEAPRKGLMASGGKRRWREAMSARTSKRIFLPEAPGFTRRIRSRKAGVPGLPQRL